MRSKLTAQYTFNSAIERSGPSRFFQTRQVQAPVYEQNHILLDHGAEVIDLIPK